MVPRKFPCKSISYDRFNATDPFWKNPPITANFYRLTSWKNGRNGAIAEKVGDVRFHQFKTADNLLAGIEFSLAAQFGDFMARVNHSLIVGKTANTEERLDWASPHGIITPRSENFLIENARFYNFNFNTAATLGTCSHCFHPAATDSGARTMSFRNFSYDAASVTRLIKYQYPYHAIFYDMDGSLTGKGAGSWATPYYAHHNQTECSQSDFYGGATCDNTVQVRRVAYGAFKPEGLLMGMGMKVLRYDDSIVAEHGGNHTEYAADKSSARFGTIKYKPKPGNPKGWAFALVTGHKYRISWGMTGLDFEEMEV